MTMPHERMRSVNQTRDFLAELKRNQDLPEAVRAEAHRLLRHYPSAKDMEQVGKGEERLAAIGLWESLFASDDE